MSATITYKDFSLDANIDSLDFLPLPLKITHGLIGEIKVELPNLMSYLTNFVKKSGVNVKNKLTVKTVFLNLETTNHKDWSVEEIKKKLKKSKEVYLKAFEEMI